MKLSSFSFASIARSTIANQSALIKAGLSSLLMRVAGLASTFALGVILARVLGPAEFGRYGLVTTLAAIGMSIGLLGTPQLAVREFSVLAARSDWASVRWLGKHIARATCLALIAIAVATIAITFAVDGLAGSAWRLALPGALLIIVTGITALTASGLRGLGLMGKGQVMDIFVRPLAAFLVLLALVIAGLRFDASTALWIQVAVAAVTALISVGWIIAAIPRSEAQISRAIPWIGIALPLGAVDLLRQLDGGYGVILMGWLASDSELGLFRVAIACNVVIGMPLTIMHIVLAPNLARLHSEGRREELQQLLSWTSAALVAIVGLGTLVLAIAGKPLIEWVFGSVYGGSWLPLMVMSIAQLVFAFFGMGPILLAMCDGERDLIRIYLLSVGAGMAAAYPLIVLFGAAGAASAMILSMGMIGLLSWRYGRRELGVDCTFLPLLRGRVRAEPMG